MVKPSQEPVVVTEPETRFEVSCATFLAREVDDGPYRGLPAAQIGSWWTNRNPSR